MNNLGAIGNIELLHAYPNYTHTSDDDGLSNLDREIVYSARASFAGKREPAKRDAGLLKFLIRHRHTSPLEMVRFVFHIRCPCFVRTHFIRHRTASLNEFSQRFKSPSSNSMYVPDNFRTQSKDNKQSSETSNLDTHELQQLVTIAYETAWSSYVALLNAGVAREQARTVLPQGTMTEFVFSMDLHNLLHLIKLRAAPDAQYETQQVAKQMLELITPYVPKVVHEVFQE